VPMVTIGGRRGAALELAAPVIIAAGCFGRDGAQQREWLRGVGALVTHTITPEPRGRGAHPLIHEATGGLLYATGFPNRGFARELAGNAATWAALPLPVIVSLVADDHRALAGMAAEIDAASCAAGIELPCNPADGPPEAANLAQRVAAVTAVTALPLIVKLAPVPDPLASANAAFAAGADAICLAHGWPAAGVGVAVQEALLAGPAIAPLTLRLVLELAEAGLEPLIGCGGVASTEAAAAYLAAGACAIQVGSALFRDPTLAAQIAADLAAGDVTVGSLDPSRSDKLA
jgi:dihydroorotate dehydrogenase (NAD+) catalytic subunit